MHPEDKKRYAAALETHLATLPPDQQIVLDGPGTTSLPAWFLGPKAENYAVFTDLITRALNNQIHWRAIEVHPNDPPYITPAMQSSAEYKQTVDVMKEELDKIFGLMKMSAPFFSMRHQGHMLWDMTLPGMVGYFTGMLFNQNNVAVEASPVTTMMELAVGDDLCEMLGYPVPPADAPPTALRPWGHITCDGSVANTESAWAARNLKYFAIGLKAAIEEPGSLLASASTIQLVLCDGTTAPLLSLTAWQLLNVSNDTVFGLTAQLQTEYGIAPSVTTTAITPFLVQTMGMSAFHEKFLAPSGIGQPVMIVPSTKHYSWPKAAALLGIGAANMIEVNVDLDARQIMDMDCMPPGERCFKDVLQNCLDHRIPVLMSVAVIGSTEESSIDPLAAMLALRDQYRKKGLEFSVHCDAAWGGYFASMLRVPKISPAIGVSDSGARALTVLEDIPALAMSAYCNEQYAAFHNADSITVDPHKAGFIPYPAGALCYRNSAMRAFVTFSSPVIYRGGSEPTVGIYGVEGSKPGAAAAAVYFSHKIIRPNKQGYGKILGDCVFTHKKLFSRVLTMATPEDNFNVTMLNRIPAAKQNLGPQKINEQMDIIKTSFVNKTNAQILASPQFPLFCELGSDQVIMAFAFNFKLADGTMNTDIIKANALNSAMFQHLSMLPGEDPNTRPLIVTSSEWSVSDYGPDYIQTFQQRMGCIPNASVPIYFLISTQMDPWTTETETNPEYGFLATIEEAYRSTLALCIPAFEGAK